MRKHRSTYPQANLYLHRPAGSPSLSRDLLLLYVGSLLTISFFWVWNPYQRDIITLVLATVVFLAGLYPLKRWLGPQENDSIPVLHMHGFFYAICFGFAGFIEPIWTNPALRVDEQDLQRALIITGLGLLSLYWSYYKIAPRWVARLPVVRWPFHLRGRSHNGVALFLYPLFLGVHLFVRKENIRAFVQIAAFPAAFFLVFLIHAYFNGYLKSKAKIVFKWLILPLNLLFLSGLSTSHIAGFVGLCIWLILIYRASTHRIPYAWILPAVLVFFLLQPIKGEFRQLIWVEHVPMSAIERLSTFFSMGIDYYAGPASYGERFNEGFETTFERINHLHVTAAVIADTPSRRPFLYGKTYLPLFTKWIPRFIWPNKPIEDLGNRWARAYGYLGANDYATSFNLPWVTEMYMNGGLVGVIAVNFLIGLVFRYLRESFWRRPEDSSAFAYGFVLGAPLMLVESHLSMKFGGLVIATMVLVAMMLLLNVFFPEWILIKRTRRSNPARL